MNSEVENLFQKIKILNYITCETDRKSISSLSSISFLVEEMYVQYTILTAIYKNLQTSREEFYLEIVFYT